MPSDGNCWYVGWPLMFAVSDGGQPVALTSMLPELKDCSAVAPSGMIGRLTLSSLTRDASNQSVFLVSVSDASCFHAVSLNGPSVTMCAGSVHLSPHFSTAVLLTGMNDVCDICWTNHGCGDVSVIFTVCLSGAVMPTLLFSEPHCWFAALG